MKPRILWNFLRPISGILLVCGAGHQAVSAQDEGRERSSPGLLSILGADALQLQKFGAQRQVRLEGIDCDDDVLACSVDPIMLREEEVAPHNCLNPEIVLGDGYWMRGTTLETLRTRTEKNVALHEATLVYLPNGEKDNSSPVSATRRNSLANVVLGVPIEGEKICWPESVEFGEGHVQIRWGEVLSDAQYRRRYGAPFAGLASIAGNSGSNPFRCLWLGCAERNILKLEVLSEPPGQSVFLNGVQQLRTNSAFSISRKSLQKLKVGFSDRDAKPLSTCKSSQIGNRKLRFTC